MVNRFRLVAWSALLFFAVLFLHTRHQDFPWYYHPDEPGKVEQVIGARPWNFHHPMLLLGSTKLVVSLRGVAEAQAVVEAGRTMSALFTAVAIVALSLLAHRWRGWPAAIGAGLSLLFHHQLYELSHYMKEDPALLMGVAVTFLGAYAYSTSPTLAAALLLGAGCGLAISGKYLGVMTLAIALPVLLRNRRNGCLTAALVAMGTIFLISNLPLLRDWETFSKSFARETKLVIEGQGQVTQSIPHSRYWSIFLANTTPVTWGLILLVVWRSWKRRRELSLAEWMMVAFPFVYALALSFSPKDNDRYFLPATAMFTFLAAGGAVELAQYSRVRSRRRLLEVSAAIALIAAQFPSWTDDRGGLLRYEEAFQKDDTSELVQWLRSNVPPNAVIAKDEKVRLPSKERHGVGPGADLLPNTILSEDYVADLGTLEELRAKGVTHIVTTPSTYQRFEREGFRPKEKAAADFERRKYFYSHLRRDFEPVKSWARGTVIYLHPGLEVYRIAATDRVEVEPDPRKEFVAEREKSPLASRQKPPWMDRLIKELR